MLSPALMSAYTDWLRKHSRKNCYLIHTVTSRSYLFWAISHGTSTTGISLSAVASHHCISHVPCVASSDQYSCCTQRMCCSLIVQPIHARLKGFKSCLDLTHKIDRIRPIRKKERL